MKELKIILLLIITALISSCSTGNKSLPDNNTDREITVQEAAVPENRIEDSSSITAEEPDTASPVSPENPSASTSAAEQPAVADEAITDGNISETGSLPLKEGTGRSSGTGWARKISGEGNSDQVESEEDPVSAESGEDIPVSISEEAVVEAAVLPETSGSGLLSDTEKTAADEISDTEAADPAEVVSPEDNHAGVETEADAEEELSVNLSQEQKKEVPPSEEAGIKGGGASPLSAGGKTASVYEEKADKYLAVLDSEYSDDSSGNADQDGSGEQADNKAEVSGRELVADKTAPVINDPVKRETEADKIRLEPVYFDDPSNIVIVLDGYGWIFLRQLEPDSRIELLSKTVDNGKTVFSFRTEAGSSLVLEFQLQNTDGSSRRAEIELKEKKPAASSGSSEAEPSQDPDRDADEAEISVKTAPLQEEQAINAEEEDEADYGKLFEEAVEYMDKGEYSRAAENLEKIRKHPEQFSEPDRLYYLLGQCYEKNRDPVAAEKYYSMVIDQFPFSLYYDRSEKRRRYLQKYFINIQ